MRFTISPCTSQGDTVFLIYDEAGEVRYRVTRSKKPAGAVLLLTDSQGTAAAKIKQRVFPPIIRYGISPAEGKNLSVTLRISGNGIPQQLILGGVTWHFRGDLVARNFDVIDVDSSVLLSHQKCWRIEWTALRWKSVSRRLRCRCFASVCVWILLQKAISTP